MNIFSNLKELKGDSLKTIVVNDRIYKIYPHLTTPTAVFALSFGLNKEVGSVNYGLSLSINDIRDYYDSNIPAIVQERIAPCINDLSITNYYAIGRDSDYKWRLDSRDILQLSIEKAIEKDLDINRIIYVAHPAHMQRVMYCGMKLGLDGYPFVSSIVQWSQNDPEKWVRSEKVWQLREIIARILYKMRGYI